ncbi:MAG: hypothetical protein ACKVGW_13900, partial [Verrucomicrobiia bacterium]
MLEQIGSIRDTGCMKEIPLFRTLFCLCGLVACIPTLQAQQPDEGFFDRWALTIPGGKAGWLEVTKEDGYYDASILWGGGSVVPVDSVVFSNDNTLLITRTKDVKREGPNGKVVRTQRFTDLITAKINGEDMRLTLTHPNFNGKGLESSEFTGKRIPPIPAKPNLKKVKYGKPIALFDGRNLDQWELLDPTKLNGWSVSDKALSNDPVQEEGKPHVRYGNLRTKATFED